MEHLPSYPSLYAFGHRAIRDILTGPVVVEEKVDGSQFSFGVDSAGQIFCRSKGQQIVVDAPDKLFAKAVETVKMLAPILRPDWVYRGEYLQKPQHNTLAYNRVPANHIILFDVMIGPENYLSPCDKRTEAIRIGLETVPCFVDLGYVRSVEDLLPLLDRESVLGGPKIEGFVIKNYNQFTPDKKIAIAKYVSAAFKEKHGVEWKKANPGTNDVVDNLVKQLRTEPRWRKAIEHLRDAGTLQEAPSDIGPLLKEINADVLKEERAWIEEHLWKHFWPKIARGITAGFPEYYKRVLAGVPEPFSEPPQDTPDNVIPVTADNIVEFPSVQAQIA